MQVEYWNEIAYDLALEKQLGLVDKVIKSETEEVLVFCRHPSVITLGKKTKPEDLAGWTGTSFKVQRGGSVTYHGPGQTVVYPIISLNKRNRDLHLFLRAMEMSIVTTLKDLYSIQASGQDQNNTGVWFEGRKLASIGVAVRKWVSYHGLAINLFRDELAFTGIRPCGFSQDTMISLEEILGYQVSRVEFENKLEKNLLHFLSSNTFA